MAGLASLTGTDNYFEAFTAGDRFRHARGKTVTEMDGVLITNLVMNTAQGHFNEDAMADLFGEMDERPRKRQAIIAANPDLQEREPRAPASHPPAALPRRPTTRWCSRPRCATASIRLCSTG